MKMGAERSCINSQVFRLWVCNMNCSCIGGGRVSAELVSTGEETRFNRASLQSEARSREAVEERAGSATFTTQI
jgi:hypothetical protein